MKVLKNSHPHAQVWNKILSFLDEKDAQISWSETAGSLQFTIEGVTYDIKDIESASYPILEFPPVTEVHIALRDDEEYGL